MEREHHTIEDFLLDKEFKKWVLNPDANDQLFWEKWLQSNPEQKDNVQKAKELLLSYRFKSVETVSQEEKEDLLAAILKPQPTKKSGYRSVWKFAVAASIIIAAVITFINLDKSTEVIEAPAISQVVKQNPVGQKSKVSLPDGSKVWLNSDSRISYPSEFQDERIIQLEGEAFFEVVKDPSKPFRVNAGGVITTALGTSFNINAFNENESIDVMLVTGKVTVANEDNANELLYISPGEQATYLKAEHSLKKSRYNLHDLLWKDGIISFEKADFNTIKLTLERWYGIKINSQNNSRRLSYTGDFDNQSLERVLERMAFSERFTFQIEGKNVNIKFE
ncbi:FecR family protein [Fulvivirga ligni]|uniref:FecR family protein n=1 Tax=Fulvivirga ligni TaxID=2904246 RepID=UPI001F42D3FF|nr:FecR domain-containing protein [Fulvivirga ligni]UII19350.1 FecR domain-containing protein [Fulvivirga ligni]